MRGLSKVFILEYDKFLAKGPVACERNCIV